MIVREVDRLSSEDFSVVRSELVFDGFVGICYDYLNLTFIASSEKDALRGIRDLVHRFRTEKFNVKAARFLGMLPENTVYPDVTEDPDGDICLEWYTGPRQVFSVSVGENGELTYAGLFGMSSINGTEQLGEVVPQVILDCLERGEWL